MVSIFLIGILITVVFEYLATDVLARWSYTTQMPTLPFIGTGLLPLIQWLIVPALSVVMVRLTSVSVTSTKDHRMFIIPSSIFIMVRLSLAPSLLSES